MSYAGDHKGGSFLRAYLSHLDPFLSRRDVTDIYINRPGEVWVETIHAAPVRVEIPELDARTIARLARQIAGGSSKGISHASPLLSASLPNGERVQVIMPPATREHIAIAIRKQAIREMTIDECEDAGLFDHATIGPATEQQRADSLLQDLLGRHQIGAFLKQAVRQRRNIVVSGGTSTGKTTFLNTLIQQIDREERLAVIEDTAEVRLDHPNWVGLVAGSERESGVTIDELLRASLRMRPSRIILGELRGPEAYSFLRAINTGHPGSITTLHADSPRSAAEQLAMMVLQSGTTLSRGDILAYIAATVDVFVQLSRIDGRRLVSAITFGPPAAPPPASAPFANDRRVARD